MHSHTPHARAASWLGPLLLLPLLAGAVYALTVWLIGGGGTAETAVAVTPAATTQALFPFPTADAGELAAAVLGPGGSRANPLPPAATLSLRHWQLRLQDDGIVRGDAAWQQLQAANSLNEPPGDGWEYLLVRLAIRHLREAADEQSLSVHVTGDSNVLHYSFAAGVVPPTPRLETTLPGKGSSEGWQAFRIRRDEGSLMLVIEDYQADEEGLVYLALAPETAVEIPAAVLDSIPVTQVGSAAGDPAAVGQTVTLAEWQVLLLDVIRGEAAWAILLERNQFNDPPPAGWEYVLAQVQVRYIGITEGPHPVYRWANFEAMGTDGTVYELPSLVHPDPELFFELYPGGEVIGWLALQVPVGEPAPLLAFRARMFNPEPGEMRYFLLAAAGR